MTPKQIAESLTEAQKACVRGLSENWEAGPDLPDDILDNLTWARSAGLVEREFADMGQPDCSKTIDGFSVRCGACWWFRLTPLGLAVRAVLMEEPKPCSQD